MKWQTGWLWPSTIALVLSACGSAGQKHETTELRKRIVAHRPVFDQDKEPKLAQDLNANPKAVTMFLADSDPDVQTFALLFASPALLDKNWDQVSKLAGLNDMDLGGAAMIALSREGSNRSFKRLSEIAREKGWRARSAFSDLCNGPAEWRDSLGPILLQMVDDDRTIKDIAQLVFTMTHLKGEIPGSGKHALLTIKERLLKLDRSKLDDKDKARLDDALKSIETRTGTGT